MDQSSLRFAIICEGSRGDFQPYAALALHLQRRGNVVHLFTNVNHVGCAKGLGLNASGVLFDIEEGLKRPDMKKAFEDGNAMRVQKGIQAMRLATMEVDTKRLFEALDEFKPSVVGAGPLSMGQAFIYSVARTIPHIAINLQVVLPVTDKAPAGLPNLPFHWNRVWFKLMMLGVKIQVPEFLAKVKAGTGVDVSLAMMKDYIYTSFYDVPSLPAPVFYGVSSVILPVHPEWPQSNFHLPGFFVIDKATQEGQAKDTSDGAGFGADTHSELMKFVQAGTPPVYMGWGSMMCKSAEYMSKIAVEALQHIGARGVICAGYSGLSKETTPADLHGYCEDNVMFVKSAPHEVLFPQCGCIVHHGGWGTTASSVRSGKPTIILPVMGDQFDFAECIDKMNCGVGLPQFSKATSTQLGDAIKKCLEDQSVIQAAKAAGERLNAENGCENFARAFDEWYSKDFQSGKWREKHDSMMARGEPASGGCTCQ